MSPSHSHAQLYTQPTFVELFTPKLVTVFREGYGWRDLRADAVSGLTVAVVALPLSMAIAIASGVSPERGLYTAIFGGLIISLIGGSRFQIGGPAGAFIGLVAGVVERHGYDGLALATVIAGLILIAVGLLRAGTYIKYIPFPVTVGFTAGIAVIIAASQIRDLFGLTIAHEPSALLPKLLAIRNALPTVHFPTLGIAILSVVLIVALRRFRPNWPSFLIAIKLERSGPRELWRYEKSFVGVVPSPLLFEGVLYIIRNGGILTAIDPATGKPGKTGRVQGALGAYSASPVAADGKIFLASEEGKKLSSKERRQLRNKVSARAFRSRRKG